MPSRAMVCGMVVGRLKTAKLKVASVEASGLKSIGAACSSFERRESAPDWIRTTDAQVVCAVKTGDAQKFAICECSSGKVGSHFWTPEGKDSLMAQQTKSKSSASSGSRSNTRKSANGRTAAKSRSRASRPQTARAPKRKANSSVRRAPSTRPRMQRRKARTPPVTPSRRPRKTQDSADCHGNGACGSRCGHCRHSEDEQGLLRHLVAEPFAKRRRVSARRPRTLGSLPSGPGKWPNRCASQAKPSARTLGRASPSQPLKSSWRGLRVASNQGLVDRELQAGRLRVIRDWGSSSSRPYPKSGATVGVSRSGRGVKVSVAESATGHGAAHGQDRTGLQR